MRIRRTTRPLVSTAQRCALWLSVALACILAGPVALAQSGQSLSVQAYVGSTTVGMDERVAYTVEVQGAAFDTIETPEPPATEGLALVYPSPSTQRNISFVNGVQQQSLAFRWLYRPLKAGTAKLEATAVTIDGRAYRTAPIQIEVVPQAQRPAQAPSSAAPFGNPFGTPRDEERRARQPRITETDIFIRAIPSKRTAYQNEQITVEYRLYFRPYVQPRESRLADSWDAEGFWREDLPVDGRPIPQATVDNGLRYNAITLKRVAVFPTRTGTLRIDPLKIETEVLAMQTANDPFGRLFSSRHPFETVELASPPIRVEATPLPADAPDAFTGAVGQFRFDLDVGTRELAVGEPLRVQMRVAGTGNLAMLEAPAFEVPGVFETYGPRVETSIDSTSQRVRGVKTFTYTLVPRSNGRFELPPVTFASFDPSAGRYRTTTTDPMPVRVVGTAPTRAASSTGAGLPVDDIAGLLTTATWRPVRTTPLHRRAWPYLALLVPLLLVGGAWAWQRHADRLAADPALARTRRAHPLARRHLKRADALRRNDQPTLFYEELERAVLGFIGNRLDVAERGLTRAELDAHLAAADVGPGLRADLRAFLATCDQMRFSPARPTAEQMAAGYDEAQRSIVALDTALRPSTPSA